MWRQRLRLRVGRRSKQLAKTSSVTEWWFESGSVLVIEQLLDSAERVVATLVRLLVWLDSDVNGTRLLAIDQRACALLIGDLSHAGKLAKRAWIGTERHTRCSRPKR